MADATADQVTNSGMQLFLEDGRTSKSDVTTTYTNQNFFRIKSGLDKTFIHFILSDATPQSDSDYNAHPIGSIVVDTVTGFVYVKDAAGDNWGKVTIVT
tara:strand:+ start:6808 stop:7104 length:297 start_codon:yes stop_codon:yes gene_type:complete